MRLWSSARCHTGVMCKVLMLQVDSVMVEGRTKRQVPGYEDGVEFGVLSSFAYPVEDSGDPHLQVLGASDSSGSEFLLECNPGYVLGRTVSKNPVSFDCLLFCACFTLCFYFLFAQYAPIRLIHLPVNKNNNMVLSFLMCSSVFVNI